MGKFCHVTLSVLHVVPFDLIMNLKLKICDISMLTLALMCAVSSYVEYLEVTMYTSMRIVC